MRACIGDRTATGEAARCRCLRVVLVLVVACASTLPAHCARYMQHGHLDIWPSARSRWPRCARSRSVAVWRFGRHWCKDCGEQAQAEVAVRAAAETCQQDQLVLQQAQAELGSGDR